MHKILVIYLETVREGVTVVHQMQPVVFLGGFKLQQLDAIDYITITTGGNALDFGNLTLGLTHGAACSSVTRCVWSGGYVGGSKSKRIQYVNISTTGDAIDFGDLTDDPHYHAACSNGHGGL